MTNIKPKILVLGATGQVGGAVIPHLATDPSAQIVAAARSADKASRLDVPVLPIDLDKPETIAPALDGVERVFMVTGYTIDMLRQSKDREIHSQSAGIDLLPVDRATPTGRWVGRHRNERKT